MEPPIIDDVLSQLRTVLERDDLGGAADIIESLRPPDQADLFNELDDKDQVALLPELNPADSADILEELDDEEVAELVAALPTETIIRIVDQMEPDEAADLLGDINPEQAQAVLAGLEDPDEVRPLLLHPDDSAGGLMTSEFLALRRRMTAREAIEAIRLWRPDAETIYYLFVIDQHGRLCGVVSLRHLVVAAPGTPVAEIMEPEVISVPSGTDQEECARLMTRYDLLALPVVDADGILLGVITVDDVIDVLEDEATEDIQRFGGAQPLERSYLDTSIFVVTRKRIGWLASLFLAGTFSMMVMRAFEDELQVLVALAAFIPLMIGTGGNAGSQTIATIIRALAIGDVDTRDALQVWWHEVRIGLALGLGMAAVAYLRAITWEPDPALALTIAASILGIILWANGLGALLPILAARLRIDPALVSGPVMTTILDATGLLIYFSFAQVILGV
jgi:magnesium transporter